MNHPQRLLETGKPDALKGARPVWEGAVGEGLPKGKYLAGGLLHKNLSEALQRCLSHHLSIGRKQRIEDLLETPPVLQRKRTPHLSPLQKQTVQLHRAERVARYEQALALRKQGLSHQAIAERVGVGHSTIQRWMVAGAFPERKRREQASQLDPYLPFIRERWGIPTHQGGTYCCTSSLQKNHS